MKSHRSNGSLSSPCDKRTGKITTGNKACIVQNLRYATFDYPQQRITKMEKENFCVGRIAVKGALRPWSVKDYPLIICTC
ncbi:hypothetical protein EYS39_14335 [Cronobacter sakazakii]|nr:hypothetical protein AXA51_19770 [Enterobacter hormaechei]EGT4442111.1 hypothetical protein [Cronobacter sakazakii]RAZ54187.1 hypothetical protein DP194_20705 [Enterobacter hormaechei subsp. xiangfangensis]EGT5703901.1 hypothetical protein [Cronobacter sakazakii]PPY11912.1 hypothetical protein C3D82_06385 [Cronobacter sakazakii]